MLHPCISNRLGYALLLTLLLVSACKKQQVLPNPDHLSHQSVELTISVGGQSLRQSEATSDPMRHVHRLQLLLFSRGLAADTLFYYREVDPGEWQDNSISLQITPDNYQLLCLANGTAATDTLLRVGRPLADFLAPKHWNSKQLSGGYSYPSRSSSAGLPMTNTQGLLPIAKEDFSPQGATPKRLSLQISPMMARFEVFGIPQVRGLRLIGGDSLYFTVIGVDRATYLLRQLAPKAGGEMEHFGDGSQTAEQYAVSPAQTAFSRATPEDDKASLMEQWVYQGLHREIIHKIPFSATPLAHDKFPGFIYQKESTLAAGDVTLGRIPHLAIGVQLAPEGLKLQPNEGWILYAGHPLSFSDFKTFYERLDQNPPLPKGMPSGFREACKELRKDKDLDSFSRGFERYGLTFYYQGYNFYFTPVRHFGDDVAPNLESYGRFGIVRNNIYRYEIKEITRLGAPNADAFTGKLSPLTPPSFSNLDFTVAPAAIHSEILSF